MTKIELYDYQLRAVTEAVEIIKKNGIAYLRMQTRTGKTLTALSVYNQKKTKAGLLFVTKKKIIPAVIKDYNSAGFTYPLHVINYESLHKFNAEFDMIVIDEAHTLGCYPKMNLRTKILKKLLQNTRIPVLYLSATPTPESFSQIYHQLAITSFSPFRHINFYKWAYQYVDIQKKYLYNREMNDYSHCSEKAINDIQHLFVSVTQQEAGFEFNMNEKVHYVSMNSLQLDFIDELKKERILHFAGNTVLADTEVKLQSKIHQICSGSMIAENGERSIISIEKAMYIKRNFQSAVVFYKFQGELEALKTVLSTDLTTDAEAFQSGVFKYYAGQFISSREGIRLDRAKDIIFYNIDFSYLSYAQAKERIMGKDITEQPTLHWLFSLGGIEQKIYNVVKSKNDYTVYHFKKDYNVRKNTASKSY